MLPLPGLGSLLLLAGISGCLHMLVHAPYDGSALAGLALAPFLAGLRIEERRIRSACAGAVYGAVSLASIAHWMPGVLVSANGLRPLHAACVFAAVAGWYAVGFAGFAVLSAQMRRGWLPAPLATACAWVTLEAARRALAPSLAWLDYGHSQHASVTTLQWAEWVGVPGLSFLLVLANAFLAEAIVGSARADRLRALASVVAAAAIAGSVFVVGRARLDAVEAAASAVEAVPFAIVQAAIPQAERWREGRAQAHLEPLLHGTREAVVAGARVVVWPETAIEMHLEDARELSAQVAEALGGDPERALLAGVPREIAPEVGAPVSARSEYRNSAVLFDGAGEQRGLYDKLDLYPVSETAPAWLGWLPGARRLFAPQLDWLPYSPGSDLRLLETAGTRLGVLICFEAVGSAAARLRAEAGAQILVQLANDAVLPSAAALAQHLAIVRFRAVELRRPLVRASNRGIGAGIDATGRLVTRLPADTPGFARLDLRPGTGETFYAWTGWRLPALACGLAVLGLLPRRGRQLTR